MKLTEYMKMGAGVYIGWEITRSIDRSLGKTKTVRNLYRKLTALNVSSSKKKETVVMGFARND